MARTLAVRASLALAMALGLFPRYGRPDDANTNGIEPAPLQLRGLEQRIALAIGVLSLVPAAAGFDTALGPHAAGSPRFVLDWPFQLALREHVERRVRTAAFATHRMVVTAGLAFGWQPGALGTSPSVTFHARLGYRAVYHPHGGVAGVLLGMGSSLEFWPSIRPSVSPEFGLHIGGCCDPTIAYTVLVVRADVFPTGPNDIRVGAQIGWTFY